MIIEGIVLRGRDFTAVEGRVVVKDGQITGIEEDSVDSTDIVLPAFVNAHTHVGDSIAKEAGEGLSLDELVAPPDGLKHRLLRGADREDLVEGMRRSARFMQHTGTGTFVDFREGGLAGVEMLQEAVAELAINPVILSRERIDAIDAGDGYGASSVRDGEFEAVRATTREAQKLFGVHAGERDSEDIDGAFDLDPDLLVHMVYPESRHLDRLAETQIPVVVCPRSNLVTGVGTPPVHELLDRTTVALGTDNVMLNAPSMFREMELTAKLLDVPAREVLRMATINGAEAAKLNCGLIEPGRDAKLLVLDGQTDNLSGVQNIVRAVVRRAGMADVKTVYL